MTQQRQVLPQHKRRTCVLARVMVSHYLPLGESEILQYISVETTRQSQVQCTMSPGH